MVPKPLLEDLFARGLGELLILHVAGETVLLGQVVYEKGRMTLKDLGFAKGARPDQVLTCIEAGVIGAVCSFDNREWETLTVLGMEHCKITGDLSATRTNLLSRSSNQYGDNLMGFEGSVYRGYKLMLESNLLPVVVLDVTETRKEGPGVAICDLRLASVPLNTIHLAYDHQQRFVEKHLTLQVDDFEVDDEEFASMFKNYLEHEKA